MTDKQFTETNLFILILCDSLESRIEALNPIKSLKEITLIALLNKLNTICTRVRKYYCKQYFGEQLEYESGDYFDRAHDHIWKSYQEFIKTETNEKTN